MSQNCLGIRSATANIDDKDLHWPDGWHGDIKKDEEQQYDYAVSPITFNQKDGITIRPEKVGGPEYSLHSNIATVGYSFNKPDKTGYLPFFDHCDSNLKHSGHYTLRESQCSFDSGQSGSPYFHEPKNKVWSLNGDLYENTRFVLGVHSGKSATDRDGNNYELAVDLSDEDGEGLDTIKQIRKWAKLPPYEAPKPGDAGYPSGPDCPGSKCICQGPKLSALYGGDGHGTCGPDATITWFSSDAHPREECWVEITCHGRRNIFQALDDKCRDVTNNGNEVYCNPCIAEGAECDYKGRGETAAKNQNKTPCCNDRTCKTRFTAANFGSLVGTNGNAFQKYCS